MMNAVLEEATPVVDAMRSVLTGPSTPDADSMEGYDEMLERHHDSIIEDEPMQRVELSADALFATSVQNLYDANG